MEQQNNNQKPKMPKFNMSWFYVLALVGLIAAYFAMGDNSVAEGSNASKEVSYEQFKNYVTK